MAFLLYLIFAAVCTAGAYLIAAHLRSRRFGVIAALCVAAFFALLLAGLFLLIRSV